MGDSRKRLRQDYLELVKTAFPGAFFVGEWRAGEGFDYTSAYQSPTMERITGVPVAQALAQPGRFLEQVHPDDREAMLRAFESLATENREIEVHYRVTNAETGKESWILERLVAVPTEDPDTRLVLGVLVDITSIRRREEELEAAEARMRVIVEGTPYLFFYTQDEKGRVTYVSPSVERITGYSVEEWLGQTHWFITDAEINEPARRASHAHLRGEDPQGPHVIEVRRKDGQKILLEVFEHPVRSGERVVGIQGVARDVTEQHRLQQALAESQKMEAVGRLTAGIAHDFNNMLQGIMMCAELAQRGCPEAGTVRWLDEILQITERGRDLIRQLLAYSRRQVLQPETLDLNEVIRRAAPLVERLVGDDVQVHLRLEEGPLPMVADATQMTQILINLAANARDAMPQGGELTITTRRVKSERTGAEEIRLDVADTGCGIEEEALPVIFEPFYTTRRSTGGTGLGLSSVLGIVREHGGTVSVSSRPGEGAVFTLRFPLADAPQGPVHSSEETPGKRKLSGGTERILLVEDHGDVRRALAELLESLGYRVVAVGSVAEAMEATGTDREIDVLVTDLQLPDGSGLDLVEALRGSDPRLPVVLISGYARGSLPGVLDRLPSNLVFVEKPVRAADLDHAIRTALEEREGDRAC